MVIVIVVLLSFLAGCWWQYFVVEENLKAEGLEIKRYPEAKRGWGRYRVVRVETKKYDALTGEDLTK